MSKKNLIKNPLVLGIAAIVVLAAVLMMLPSSTPQPEVVQVPVPVYVCWDNSVVQDPAQCPPETNQLITATPEMCASLQNMPFGDKLAGLLGCPTVEQPTQPTNECSLLDRMNPASPCFIDGTPTATCWDGSEVADKSMCPPEPCNLANPLTYGQCAHDASGMAADQICQMSPDLAGFMGIMCPEQTAPTPIPTQQTQENECHLWNPFTWGSCSNQLTESVACSVDENLARSMGWSCGYTAPTPTPIPTPYPTPVPTYSSGSSVMDWLYGIPSTVTTTANNIITAPVNYISDATSGVTEWLADTSSGITNTLYDSTSGITNTLYDTTSGITNAISDSYNNFESGLNNLTDSISGWLSGWF